jgi:hypothetical protein
MAAEVAAGFPTSGPPLWGTISVVACSSGVMVAVTTDVRVVVIGKAVVRVVPPWIIVLRTVTVCTMGVSLLVKVWTRVAVVGKSTVVMTGGWIRECQLFAFRWLSRHRV